jgi:WD40-like Beta Propeller Repeat
VLCWNKESGMKGKKLTLSIAAISMVGSLNVSSKRVIALTARSRQHRTLDETSERRFRDCGGDAAERQDRLPSEPGRRRRRVRGEPLGDDSDEPHALAAQRALRRLVAEREARGLHPVRQGAGNLFRISRSGTGLRRLTSGAASDEAPRWSPDGSAIAFDRTGEDGQADVFVVDARGTTVTRLTANALGDYVGGWSPEGTKIAIYRGVLDTEQFDIWVVNVDGSGEMQLTDDPGDEFSPVFSPDAARIAFMRRLGDQWDIFVMNADGTNVTRLTDDPLDDAFPQWSPQGERICSRAEGSRVRRGWTSW